MIFKFEFIIIGNIFPQFGNVFIGHSWNLAVEQQAMVVQALGQELSQKPTYFWGSEWWEMKVVRFIPIRKLWWCCDFIKSHPSVLKLPIWRTGFLKTWKDGHPWASGRSIHMNSIDVSFCRAPAKAAGRHRRARPPANVLGQLWFWRLSCHELWFVSTALVDDSFKSEWKMTLASRSFSSNRNTARSIGGPSPGTCWTQTRVKCCF